MKILITGSSGFIGSHLVKHLSGRGMIIVPYDIIDGQDVLDRNQMLQDMRGIDIVIHCAAIAGIYRTAKNYRRTMDVDLIGTYNALETARVRGVRLFVDFSTSEVYGPMIYDGKETDATTQGPIDEGRWAYAVSKLASEYLTRNSGMPHVIVRPFNVFGPGQTGEGAVHDIVIKALADEPITVYNDGTQIRSWCYITDFVDAMTRLLFNEKAWNQVYNIGNPQNTITVLGLARDIIRLASSKSEIVFKPHPGPEVHVRVPNIEKAKAYLGYQPQVILEDGLKQTIEHYRNG